MDRVAAMSTILLQILSERYASGEDLVNPLFLIDMVILHIAYTLFDQAHKSGRFWYDIIAAGLLLVFLATTTWRSARFYSLMFCYIAWFLLAVFRGAMDKVGAGSLFFFLEYGIIAVQVTSLNVFKEWTIRRILECAPAHFLIQGAILARETSGFEESANSGVRNTPILLGRHDAFRLFFLFHMFAFVFIGIDTVSLEWLRGLPMILLPWSLSLIYSFKQFYLSGLPSSAYRQYLLFVVLICLSILGPKLREFKDLKLFA
jgi:1,4-dihydroxy-2-naphthoate octaprenyltransferase